MVASLCPTGFEEEPGARAFLGVEKSLTGRIWRERLDGPATQIALALAQQHDVPDVLARVLAGRGVTSETLEAFLEPTLRRSMPDPSTLTDMDKAADRLADAILAREAIAVFGDYDVDGATSSALMVRYLRHFGLDPAVHIPDRIFEGYGPNIPAIRALAEQGARLLITVDCGTASFDALEEAAKLGLDTLVLDHHQTGETLPATHALVNPNRQDDLSGQGHLAAVGVTFLTLVAASRSLRAKDPDLGARAPNLMAWLDLVALGTVCDVVPLTGLNRAYVVRGLDVMRGGANPGLAALRESAKITGPLEPYHLGYVLGPRINAGGRIGDAALGTRLLSSDDPEIARDIALKLEALNKERQALEQDMLDQAMVQAGLDDAAIAEQGAVLVADGSWHPGVLGLIAARLKERFRVPAFAIGFDVNGRGTGSGRSVPGVDLGAVVRGAVEAGLLVKGGGHGMAAGLTVEKDRFDAFRAFALERIRDQHKAGAGGADRLDIDAAMTSGGAHVDLIGRLEQAGPFGAGHPEPVFAFPAHRITYAEVVGGQHVRLTLATGSGAKLNGISFRSADEPLGRALLGARGGTLHVAGSLSINHWRGTSRPQLRVLDVADPAKARP